MIGLYKNILLTLLIAFCGFGVFAQSSLLGTTMPTSQAKLKWGEKRFNDKQFKFGNPETRSSMVYAIIEKKHDYIGKTPEQIRSIFGETDGYFVNEAFPAYILSIHKKKGDKIWQLVFEIGKNKKVSDIIIFTRSK